MALWTAKPMVPLGAHAEHSYLLVVAVVWVCGCICGRQLLRKKECKCAYACYAMGVHQTERCGKCGKALPAGCFSPPHKGKTRLHPRSVPLGGRIMRGERHTNTRRQKSGGWCVHNSQYLRVDLTPHPCPRELRTFFYTRPKMNYNNTCARRRGKERLTLPTGIRPRCFQGPAITTHTRKKAQSAKTS
jgi:hypothetical protein